MILMMVHVVCFNVLSRHRLKKGTGKPQSSLSVGLRLKMDNCRIHFKCITTNCEWRCRNGQRMGLSSKLDPYYGWVLVFLTFTLFWLRYRQGTLVQRSPTVSLKYMGDHRNPERGHVPDGNYRKMNEWTTGKRKERRTEKFLLDPMHLASETFILKTGVLPHRPPQSTC
jgi:hypothetical protein